MSQQNLCFFSTRCRYSQAFLEELARSPFSREFRFVCVDPNPVGVRPSLPPYVRAVPTLMIVGEREPRTDGRVMEWLTERRMRERGETNAVAARPGAPMGSAAPAAPMMGDGPAAVFGMDLNGIGDEGFAFLDDDTAATTTSMVRMGGTMAAYGHYTGMNPEDSMVSHMGSATPFADPGSSSSAKQSAKAKAMDDAMARLMASRDSDIHIPPPIQRK
jgi:hypothetical protein